MKKIFLLLFTALNCSAGFAQFTNQLGTYEALPQRHLVNPALIPAGTFNIGLPALSNIYIEHGNSWFRPRDFFSTQGASTYFDSDEFLKGIDKHATTAIAVRVDLINFGFKIKKHYFSFNTAERISARAAIPKDLLWLGVYGNVNPLHPLDKQTADLTGFALDAIHYREFTAGWGYELNENWSFGFRLKYLYGMENVSTAESTLKLRTDPSDFSLHSSGRFEINTAGMGGSESDEDIREDVKTYLLGLSNRGWGADIGATWRPIDRLQLQLSVNDVGYIRWNNDVANYYTDEADFAFNGFDLSEFILSDDSTFDEAFDEELEHFGDSLKEAYNFSETYESYRSGIYAYTRIAAEYQLYDNGKTSGKTWLAGHFGLGNKMIPLRLQAGYQQSVKKWLAADFHLTWQEHTVPFAGAGIVLNGGAFQFYTLVENLHFLQLVKLQTEDDGGFMLYPANSGDIRLNIGFNLTFGRKKAAPAGKSMI